MRQLRAEAEQNARDLPVLSGVAPHAAEQAGLCVEVQRELHSWRLRRFAVLKALEMTRRALKMFASKGIDRSYCGPNMADRHLFMRSPAP